MSASAPLRVAPVVSKADLDQFIALPNLIFKADPAWVPPLRLERRQHLSAKTNPWFEHARWKAWLAWRGNRPVGRISAQVDALYLEHHADSTGFFGMLDAEDQQETFAVLLHTAEQWLREEGMARVRGPFNLSINDEVGLLVEGFDTPPMFMMGHARPYYHTRLEQCGYGKAKDLLAYIVGADFPTPKIMQRLIGRSMQRIRVRALDLSRFDEELRTLRDIFNDAWSENWGFVPFTDAEFTDLGRNLRSMIAPELIQIAEVDGEPAAFVVAVPNLNEAIRDLNGKLLPFGWAKLLWRLKVRFPKTVRSPLMGVRRVFHDTPLGPCLAFLVIEAGVKQVLARGARHIEMSWILENNAGMRHIVESMGGEIYKRYRVYEKPLP
ncbi:dATP pyrophosphohydrolase [Burkholderia sp. 22PA0106]|uniref:dATP pyrophosphohydrolase n=1 Tax=Burkholderia sp. 22PA0106 TaxID=3237371 RepID=UPI0039C44F34